MSQIEKAIEKFINSPFPKWDDVVNVLGRLGYAKIEKEGSRIEFWNKEKNSSILLHKPHPGNTIKTYTKKDIIEKLKKSGFIK